MGKGQKDEAEKVKAQVNAMAEELDALQAKEEEYKEEIRKRMMVIPNIIDVKTIADAVQAACYSGIDQAKVLFSPATPSLRSAQTLGQEYSHQVNEL